MNIVSSKTQWSIPVTRTLDEAVEEAVNKGTYASKSDFIRDAVRRRLEEMGFKVNVFPEGK